MLLTAASLIVIVGPRLPFRLQQSSPIALTTTGNILTARPPDVKTLWMQTGDQRLPSVIPIAGIIVGNSMHVASVTAARLVQDANELRVGPDAVDRPTPEIRPQPQTTA